jgi:hypothetical protein
VSIVTTLLSGATAFFGGAWGYVLSAAAAGALAVYLTHAIDTVRYDTLVQTDLKATIAAQTIATLTQKNQDDAREASAVSEATAQANLSAEHTHIIERIPTYVTPAQDASHCITFGLLRVLDATILAGDPAALPLPPGKSDDSCSPVTSSLLARQISDNYAVARANAEQLNALEDSIRSIGAATDNSQKPAAKPGLLQRLNPF